MKEIEAILLVWGVRDEVLEKLPVDGYWLYGEYDFIAKVEFRDVAGMERFVEELRRLINGGTFKLMPVTLSAVKNGAEGSETVSVLESLKVSAP
ncbi:Lrp/AsnC ligand binding domain-containing protein [Thermococcus sp.]|uniref:Lrp/AsnC ligand binding domain-containing protein n=1 Tax=Thermococcus sp. TaxID=35749 RepID=UPI0026131DD5|nr:Lrp/AsnC ligand binding domain-containing protein [Thermococcus sp.]